MIHNNNHTPLAGNTQSVNDTEVIHFFQKFLARPIAFHPIFAKVAGGVTEGLFLSQAYYWSLRTKNPLDWFYKSIAEWEEETVLTRTEQEVSRKKLKALGVLEEKKEGLPCKLYYRLNHEKLYTLMVGTDIKDLSLVKFIEIYGSVLVGLSKAGLMRATQLKVEREYVDYREILKEHDLICHICNQPITKGIGQSGGHLHFDHVIPLNKGGEHKSNNILPSHAHCNLSKSDRTLDKSSLSSLDKLESLPKTSKRGYSKQASVVTQNKQVSFDKTDNLYTEITPEITSETTSPPISPKGQERERELNFFEFQTNGDPKEVLSQLFSAADALSTVTSESQNSSKSSIVPADENDSHRKFDRYFTGQSRQKPNENREANRNWLPDGAWKKEQGYLDEEFVNAIANKWLLKYGTGTLAERKADVISHFINKPEKLPVEWQWYQEQFFHRASNVAVRKINGLDTAADEAKLQKQMRAITPLDPAQSVTESKPPMEIVKETAPYTIPTLEALRPPGVCEAIAGVKNPIVKAAAIDAVVQQVMSPSEVIDQNAYTATVKQEDRDFWRQQHERYANRATESTKATQPASSSDELQKAKDAIEALRKKQAGATQKKQLTALTDMFAMNDDFTAILSDKRKMLHGTDEMRQDAINWASDPVNGCELVRDTRGKVVDIREVDF